ncbi:MAG: MGH1-like glycoside hydrolase domain-containing protein, partial [Acidimicrobiales bacterium]
MTVLREQVRHVMERHWRPAGFTAPNEARYPYRWLWDSCFHAVIWVELGEAERALAELRHLFRYQDDLGFVPHIDYEEDPGPRAG